MDSRTLREFARMAHKAPRKFAAASGMLLNNMAFGTRQEAINVISERMFVKQPGFVPRRLVVKKSHFRLPISTQVSEVGSLALPRFSGWLEQETGASTNRSRVFTLLARRGSRSRTAVRSARLLSGKDLLSADEMSITNAKNDNRREEIFLRILQRRRYRKPFLIRKHSKFSPGVYRMRGGRKRSKLQLLQSTKPRRVQPRRLPWLTLARERYLKSGKVERQYRYILSRILKK